MGALGWLLNLGFAGGVDADTVTMTSGLNLNMVFPSGGSIQELTVAVSIAGMGSTGRIVGKGSL